MPYPTQWADYDPKKFMCALCFEILDVSRCAIVNGDKIDICEPCIEMENASIERRSKTNVCKAWRDRKLLLQTLRTDVDVRESRRTE